MCFDEPPDLCCPSTAVDASHLFNVVVEEKEVDFGGWA